MEDERHFAASSVHTWMSCFEGESWTKFTLLMLQTSKPAGVVGKTWGLSEASRSLQVKANSHYATSFFMNHYNHHS